MDFIRKEFGLSYKELFIFAILLIFFYFAANPVNINKQLTTTFIVASIGLAAIVGAFYRFVIEKIIQQKLEKITYSIWVSKFSNIKNILDWINGEVSKSEDGKINFKELENKTEKLFEEISYLTTEVGRYELNKYINLSMIFFSISTLFFFIDFANPNPITSLSQDGNVAPYPLYFSFVAFLFFLVGFWYMFKTLFVWQEIQHK